MARFISIGLLLSILFVNSIDANQELEPRVYYGQKADKKYSFLVFLIIRKPNKLSDCGGSIVDRKWILTAAHCVVNDGVTLSPDSVSVYAGSNKQWRGMEYSVEQIFSHEEYTTNRYRNDIALLKLTENISPQYGFPSHIARSASPTGYAGQTALIMGWGATETKSTSVDLRTGFIKFTAKDKCFTLTTDELRSDKLCSIVAPKGATHTGKGDSGSPVMMRTPRGTMYQVGLVSEEIRYTGKNVYEFTDVGHYYTWITSIIAANYF